MMDTLVLIIYIVVLFSFILRCQILFMEIKNGQKHIMDILLKLMASKDPQQIKCLINDPNHANNQQNNRQDKFTRTIFHRIKKIINNKSTKNAKT